MSLRKCNEAVKYRYNDDSIYKRIILSIALFYLNGINMKLSKYIFPATLIVLVVFYAGCNPREDNIALTGIDTLSTDTKISGGNVLIQGFDFSGGRIKFADPSLGTEDFDISMEVQLNNSGEAVSAKFVLPSGRPAFIDMGYTTLDAVYEAPPNGYVAELWNIELGHTYCIITAEEKYAKMHIYDLDLGERPSGSAYASIKFDWAFQENGDRRFEDPDYIM